MKCAVSVERAGNGRRVFQPISPIPVVPAKWVPWRRTKAIRQCACARSFAIGCPPLRRTPKSSGGRGSGAGRIETVAPLIFVAAAGRRRGFPSIGSHEQRHPKRAPPGLPRPGRLQLSPLPLPGGRTCREVGLHGKRVGWSDFDTLSPTPSGDSF